MDRIERLCAAHDDDDERALRIELIEELRRAVGFGWYVWALTDPDTTVASAPLADVPETVFADLPGLIRRRYLTTVNRWTELGDDATSLFAATGGDPDRSLLYRETLRDVGIGDVASIRFADAHGPWGWLELWRGAGDEPFAARELDALTRWAPPITAALRRSLAATFALPAEVPARAGPVVLVLAPDLQVRAQTPDTDEYLRALLPPDADRRPIPAGAYNVAAQLLANEAGIDDHPPAARVRLRGGVWLAFRAARVDQDIAVTIEPASPAERRTLFARAHGLSPRESELLGLVVEGADTRTIAGALYLSEHTVQDHLKSIFAKTGTNNRRTLVTRVAGS